MDALITDLNRMEPMLPPDGQRQIEDAAYDMVSKASLLAGQLNPIVASAVGELVRPVNCYYSNLIEGHDTHPRDIDRALHNDYSTEPTRRALQLEAVAHIEVQQAIDEGRDNPAFPASPAYALWLHREFCRQLPEELLWVDDPEASRRICVQPGELRDGASNCRQTSAPRGGSFAGIYGSLRAGLRSGKSVEGAPSGRGCRGASSLFVDSSVL